MREFLEYKGKAVSCIAQCIAFAERNGFNKYTEALRSCKSRVENDRLTLVGIGEARRGKSTFWKEYLQEDGIFPIDVDVTTCLVSEVRYGEKEKITVTFADGAEKVLTRAEIVEYASELRNKGNEKNAKKITVEIPNEKLRDGITVVDTPGLGSLNQQHTDITLNYLAEADIVLFISDAEAQLTQSQLRHIANIKKLQKNILFILTKTEANPNYEQIMYKNIELISDHAGISANEINFIPVSSFNYREGLAAKDDYLLEKSNFAVLDKAIWDTITEKRADIIIAPPLADVETVLRAIANEIQIQVTAVNGNKQEQEDLKARLKELQTQRQNLLSENAAWKSELQHEISKIGIKRRNRFTDFVEEANAQVKSCLDDDYYIANPAIIGNEIEQLAQITGRQIDDEVYDALAGFENSFSEKTGLSIYGSAVNGGLADRVPDSNIKVQRGLKHSWVRAIGEPVSRFFSLGTYFMLRDKFDNFWNKADDKMKGIRKLEEYGPKHIPQIKAELNNYINSCVSKWRGEHDEFMLELSHSFMTSLEKAIRQSLSSIEGDAALLNGTLQQNEQKKVAAEQKLSVLNTEFSTLISNYKELRRPNTADANTAGTNTAKNTTNVDYSHLED
jgi:hypothetical protein